MRRALAVFALCIFAAGSEPEAQAADLWRATLVPGADAGTGAKEIGGWLPGNQFMVSCSSYSGVTYRLCPAVDAGPCAAFSTDAPIETGKQVDLCAPSGYTALALYKLYDGGNPSCGVFLVTPKTVCQ